MQRMPVLVHDIVCDIPELKHISSEFKGRRGGGRREEGRRGGGREGRREGREEEEEREDREGGRREREWRW
jgi:hypothetical protein